MKKYIAYMYILERQEDEAVLSYLGFPNTNIYCSIFKYAGVIVNDGDAYFIPSKLNDFTALLYIDFYKYGSIVYRGKIFEITICFKPLGINAFLPENFNIKEKPVISFLEDFKDFHPKTAPVFSAENNIQLMGELETYLLGKYNGFAHAKLEQILETIQVNRAATLSVKDIAVTHKVTRTTLHNYFIKYLGITPSQFIKINRFRNAIMEFSSKTSGDKLVDIAYLTEYFDQSHMVKDFKALTGLTPKVFFKKLTQLENCRINWVMSDTSRC